MSDPVKKLGWSLLNAAGEQVRIGDKLPDFRGDMQEVRGGNPPHKSSSSGKVYVLDLTDNYEGAYYPSVIGCKWVED